MVLSTTRIVGGGNFQYVLNDTTKVIIWTLPMRQNSALLTKLVNVTQVLNLTIVSHTTNAAGHILTTTYTGDASTWLATDGLAMMIDDNIPAGLFTTTPLAVVGQIADMEVIWTEKVTRGERYERLNGPTQAIAVAKNGMEFGCDAVGVMHQLIFGATGQADLFNCSSTTGWAIRDAWINFGPSRAIIWTTNAANTDSGTVERCVFQSGAGSLINAIRLRTEGFDKKITFNNCKFMFTTKDQAGTKAYFGLDGAHAHSILVNFSTFWRIGQIFRTANAANVMTVKNSIIFAESSQSGTGAIATYSNCIGTAIAAGVTTKTESECFLAYHKAPKSSTNFPLDPSSISDAASATKDAGVPIAGITEDTRGVVRDVTTPDIGPEEDFTGFGEPVATLPGTPVIVT